MQLGKQNASSKQSFYFWDPLLTLVLISLFLFLFFPLPPHHFLGGCVYSCQSVNFSLSLYLSIYMYIAEDTGHFKVDILRQTLSLERRHLSLYTSSALLPVLQELMFASCSLTPFHFVTKATPSQASIFADEICSSVCRFSKPEHMNNQW